MLALHAALKRTHSGCLPSLVAMRYESTLLDTVKAHAPHQALTLLAAW